MHLIFRAYSLITIFISSGLILLLPSSPFGEQESVTNGEILEAADDTFSTVSTTVFDNDILDEATPLLSDETQIAVDVNSRKHMIPRKDADLSLLPLFEQLASPYFM